MRWRIDWEESGKGKDLRGGEKIISRMFIKNKVEDKGLKVNVVGFNMVGYMRLKKRGKKIEGKDGIGGDFWGGKIKRKSIGEEENEVIGGEIWRFERRRKEKMRRGNIDDKEKERI